MVAHMSKSFLLLISLLSINLLLSTIEGRILLTVTHDNSASHDHLQVGKTEKIMLLRGEIGSKPPRCEGRCKSCGHCEAIQVPIYSTSVSNIDYKPITWKCKCGSSLFNP